MERSTDETVPRRILKLPVTQAGYRVPWFVAWIDGQPDFRVVAAGKVDRAVNLAVCWICGEPLGALKSFVIGPMCAVNRVSAEPPSHTECAVYAATHCPFLMNPKKRRREGKKPEDAINPAGVMIMRNPGVALVWTTRRYRQFPATAGDSGVLFDVGDPVSTEWYAEGRAATRAEVLASIESGLPILRGEAEAGGPMAVAELDRMVDRALPLLPPEPVGA